MKLKKSLPFLFLFCTLFACSTAKKQTKQVTPPSELAATNPMDPKSLRLPPPEPDSEDPLATSPKSLRLPPPEPDSTGPAATDPMVPKALRGPPPEPDSEDPLATSPKSLRLPPPEPYSTGPAATDPMVPKALRGPPPEPDSEDPLATSPKFLRLPPPEPYSTGPAATDPMVPKALRGPPPEPDSENPPATNPAPLAPAPEPVPLPSSKEMTTSYEGAFVRMLVTLLGLVFLVFATFWVLKRMGKGKFKMGSGNTINVIERRALSPKSMLYVVEIGNKKVLISESQLEVRALTSFEELPETSE